MPYSASRKTAFNCALAAFSLVVACETPAATPSFSIDTLASGVVVINNSGAGAWGERPWQLELVARLGSTTDPEPSVFGRIVDVAIGPRERIHVLDRQAQEVRVFQLTGAHDRTIGRSGRGPGEFLGPYALAFDPQGNLWVADEAAVRYTIFDSAGRVLRTLSRTDRYFLSPGVLAFAPDGSFFETGFLGRSGRGVVRFRADSTVFPLDTIRIPGFEARIFPRRDASPEGGGVPIPFAPWQRTTVASDGRVWVGTGESYEIFQVADGGDTTAILRRVVEPTPLSNQDRLDLKRRLDEIQSNGYVVDETAVPDVHPYFIDLIAADDGHLWVSRVGDGGRSEYDVFGPDLRYLGTLAAPFTQFPSPHVTRNYVVGVTLDSLDVPYVEAYRIVK